MNLVAMSVHDVKADYFSPPFFARSRNEGIRSFADAAKDPQSRVNQYPDDFVLYQIGSFSDDSARFIPLDVPDRICSAFECLSKL